MTMNTVGQPERATQDRVIALFRNELDYLSPGDFLTLQAYQRARQQLVTQLHACERQYGEI